MVNVIGLLWGLTSITPRFPAQKLDSLQTGKPGLMLKAPPNHLSKFKQHLYLCHSEDKRPLLSPSVAPVSR